MTGKVAARKAALRDRLIDAAEAQIAKGGIRSIKARDLAKEAGCALGAIYNVFDDMTALVMEVNGRTFRRLGRVVAASTEGAGEKSPTERLVLMSHAYLQFAAEQTYLWRALFDLEMASDGPVPEWYLQELEQLFAHINAELQQLYPDMAPQERDLMTRTLFSSVHGIVLLGLEKRISGVPVQALQTMIGQLLTRLG